jgi:hypothetical protein
VRRPQVSEVRVHTGLTPYFAYTVLYDAETGAIGLKPRAGSKMETQ